MAEESAWQRADQQAQQDEQLRQRTEQLQSNAESAGLAGAVGFAAMGLLAPAAARGAAKKGLQAAGRRAAKSSTYKKAKSRARKYSEQADDAMEKGSSRLAKSEHMDRAIKEIDSTSGRAAASAARQSEKGRSDLSGFLSDVGVEAPSNLRKQGREYRQFRKSQAAKEKGVVRAFMESNKQRRLMASRASEFGREQMVNFPATFAVDSALGVTGQPSDTPAYDVPGQLQNAIEYVPTYAAYEAAGAAAMGTPGLAKKGLKSAKEFLSESDTAARAVSQSYKGVEQTADKIRDVSSEVESRYGQRVREAPASQKPEKAYEETKSFLQERGQQVKDSVMKGSGGPGMEEDITRKSSTLLGAKDVFGREKGRREIKDMMVEDTQDSSHDASSVMQETKEALFRGRDKQSQSFLGDLFGGKSVRVGDVTSGDSNLNDEIVDPKKAREEIDKAVDESKINLSDQAKQELAEIKTGLSKTKRKLNNTGNIKSQGAKEVVDSMQFEDLRIDSHTKIGGEIMRMPTGDDMMAMANRVAQSATKIRIPGSGRQGISMSDTVGGRTFGGRMPAVSTIEGGVPALGRNKDGALEDRFAFFGKSTENARMPRGKNTQVDQFERGLSIRQDGFRRAKIYGQKTQGGIVDLADEYNVKSGGFFQSPYGRSKAADIRGRQHLEEEQYQRTTREKIKGGSKEPNSFLGQQVKKIKDKLKLGKSETGLIQRARDLVSEGAPRRNFAPESNLWNISPATAQKDEMLPIADAVHNIRQSLTSQSATNVYTNPKTFGKALGNLGLKQEKIDELGGAEGILNDPEKAFQAAKHVMRNVTDNMQSAGNRELQAPSASEARRYIREADRDPNTLHNKFGQKRTQALRRFVFEQGAIGTGHGQKITDDLRSSIDDLSRKGDIKTEAAEQAKTGLLSVDTQLSAGRPLDSPYDELERKGAQFGMGDGAVQRTLGVIKDNRKQLEKFASTRPRVDTEYDRNPLTTSDRFEKPYDEAGFFLSEPSARAVGGTYLEAGADTMRRALGEVGLGWSPQTSLTKTEGLREFGKTQMSRAAGAVGASLAYRAADGTADMALPDEAPMGEGITTELADIAANARLTASYLYDTLGITEMAQGAEGLAPDSVSTIPGAAAGFAATGGILGAVAGAVINRVTQPMLTDTPFEALSILPPLAPFVSNMAEPFNETKAKYEGREWVPQRSGRFFMLSGTNFEGERVEQYRPNWYTQQKADVEATPVKYGSKMEQMIFEDLPLVDFAPGDLAAPQYLQNKHRDDRPYAAPETPFSEVPLIGPTLGTTVGRAYNALHPNASNEPPVSGPVYGKTRAGDGAVATPMGNSRYARSGVAREGMTAYRTGGERVVSDNSLSSSFNQQVYEATEGAGLLGFYAQQAAGGETLLNQPRVPSASDIDSNARSFHDMKMGDMLGIGEALRRVMPYERSGRQYGPPNNQPEWMAEEYKTGDPYCVLPSTLIEINEELIPAEEAYEKVQSEEDTYARTHKANLKEIEAAQARPVDEQVTNIEVEGLPWELSVTDEHPVLVLRENPKWVLAGDIEEGDTLLEPVGPDHNEIVYQRYDRGKGHPYQWTMPQSAETIEGILALQNVEPPPKDTFLKNGLTTQSEFKVDRAFGLPGGKTNQRRKLGLCRLRREMEEKGLPDTIVGSSISALRPIIRNWGALSESDKEIRVEITSDTVRPDREEWNMYSPYEASRTDAECVRAAAYTLTKALAAAGTAPTVEQSEEGYEIILSGLHGGKHLFSQRSRNVNHRQARKWTGAPFDTVTSGDNKYVKRKVTSTNKMSYEGDVYAFRVASDESFVAAGLATHNSQVPMGETLMPGAGLEATGKLTEGKAALQAKDVGRTARDTAMRQLDVKGSENESWAKEAVRKRLEDADIAVRTEAVYVDEQNRVTGVADAATQGNEPIVIEEVSEEEYSHLESGGGTPKKYQEQLNTIMGAGDQSKGMIAFINQKTGELQTRVESYDEEMYRESAQKLRRGREMAEQYREQGYGSPGSLYSPVDRLIALQNADAFSDTANIEMKKAKKMYHSGGLTRKEQTAFEQIAENRKEMRKPFEMHPERFGAEDLLDPSSKHTNMSYNENVRAADKYSLSERILGSAWETGTSLRSPLHTKFFGNYTPQEQYERNVLLERDFQSWGEPVDDFVRPYAYGLASADDPAQGAASFALGGAVFGNPALGAAGAAVGAAYGTARGAYETATGDDYITPDKIEETREVTQRMDRVRYKRANALEAATGASRFGEAANETTAGWVQQGIRGEGWAKNRTRAYNDSGPKGQAQPGEGWQGRDPTSQPIPPELLTIFEAAPETEGNYVRPFLMTQDEDAQENIKSAVSEDMAAMLDTGWSYMHNQPLKGDARKALPGGPQADLTAHPSMGLGADTDAYEVKTIEDSGISAHDAGVGWKGAMERMEGAFVEQSAIESVQDATQRQGSVSKGELMQIIRTALKQMGINADVSVQEVSGPSEIHIREGS